MSSPRSKRSFDIMLEGSRLPLPLGHHHFQASDPTLLATEHDASSRASTPLSSIPDHTSTRPSSPPSGLSQIHTAMENPAKKAKLTFAEKQVVKLEKEFKIQQKADEKVRREAEREAKKEEKRAKAEQLEQKKREREHEREEKRRQQEATKEEKKKVKEAKAAVKEAEIAAREAERKCKEEEKTKKERSQMKLNAFFAKPATKPSSATSSRRSSIASLPGGSPARPPPDLILDSEEDQLTEYDKLFPAFFLHTNTTIAPLHRFEDDAETLTYAHDQIANGFRNPQANISNSSSLKRSLQACSKQSQPTRRRCRVTAPPVRDLVSRINGTSAAPTDLTASGEPSAREALDALSRVPVKYLKYAEDVRPPYIGTFTKVPGNGRLAHLCRNPFARTLKEVDYDYDSEAEWEEPEEGEDLNSDDDEEEADDDDADMDGFLDDEDDADAIPKRRNLMGDMEPVSTPLFWQSGSLGGSGCANVAYGKVTMDLSQYRISPLLIGAMGPIDPHSARYWTPAVALTVDGNSSNMAPPPSRVPLRTLHGPNNPPLALNALTSLSAKSLASLAAGSKTKTVVKPFPADLLSDFKREIDGSDLTKIGLVEVLKKKFPQVTGKTVSETLPLVAKREGKTAAEKKWVLL